MEKLLEGLKRGLLVFTTADITLSAVLVLLVTAGITNYVLSIVAACLFCSVLSSLLMGKLIKDGNKENKENKENKD